MIPVQQQLEPSDFAKKVQSKGLAFLQKHPKPVSWNNREYWRDSLRDLFESYDQVCAYSAHWMPYTEGSPTVDHFIPKSIQPALAYEWSNFRLSCLRMNSNKRDFQDVLDPFLVQQGWFTMDFPSLLIKPNRSLEESIKDQVKDTIKRLKLNDNDNCVRSRQQWLMSYCEQEFKFEFLKKVAPFIAYELERQNLIDEITSIMIPLY